MACTACLVLPCFALLVAATKIDFEEQALVVGTKQSRQADIVDGPACLALCPLLGLTLLFKKIGPEIILKKHTSLLCNRLKVYLR
jgi:hypothetical protein